MLEYWFSIILLLFVASIHGELVIGSDEIQEDISGLYTIEGKVYPPETYDNYHDAFIKNWQINTEISINSAEFKGFLREDGTFVISGVPSGSYLVEIHNPDYFYESVRVEINPKGKFRARKVNYILPSQIVQVPYPLKLKALTRFKYFQTREQWKITDLLFSPMILMMVLPLLLMLILPKIINDPEAKKEMENMQLPKMTHDIPEISDLIASLFTDGSKQPDKEKKSVNSKQTKKRN